jgi:hypothetical protein
MPRKALEIKHLSPSRGSMRGTWRKGSCNEDSERQGVEGFGNRAFLLLGSIREPKALSKGGLSQHVYWTRLLSFNRIQSWVVTYLLTTHNTLRKHLYTMGLSGSHLCRCRAQEETSAHILCECEALAILRHTYLGSFFLDPEDVRSLSVRAFWIQKRNRAPITWTSV